MAEQPVSQPTSTNKAVRYAAFIGALVGAFFARPVIKPWLDRHINFTPVQNWPMIASFVPWVIFSLYWEIAAKNSAPAIKSESRFSRAIHVVLANAALLLIFFPIPSLNQQFLPDNLFFIFAGIALEFAGVAIAIWARRILGRNWSGEITIKADHELIRTGPYGVVRHPIYTGLLAMYIGAVIVSGHVHALVGLLLGILAYLRKVRMEETNLTHAFGEKYSAYKGETWSLVPGLY